MGILTASISYPLLFMSTGGFKIMIVIIFAAVAVFEAGTIYIAVAKRFRADTQPKR
jgi:hypothetical protein